MDKLELTRRRILGVGAGAALGAALPALPAWATPGQQRPNILWLVSEDNGPFVGAYGDSLARTPTIDRLAAGGVRYVNAFATAPVCAPSRFSIITGMHAEAAGPAHHMRASGHIPSFVKGFPQYLRAAGYHCTNNDKTDYNAPININSTWNASGGAAHWKNRPAGAPFFAVFNHSVTHESNLFNHGAPVTRPADVRVPAYLPDLPAIRRDRAYYYDRMARLDQELKGRLAELEAAGLADDTIVFYYSDHGGALPRTKRFCYDSGLRVPLVVRFPPRWAHLAPAAAGTASTAPVSLVDLAPTVLSLAGVAVPTYMHGRALAGPKAKPPATYAFGMRNRMGERYDMVRTVRDRRYRYIRNYTPHRPWGAHQTYAWQQDGYRAWEKAFRDGKLNSTQARFFGPKPAEELYDLQADPDEVRNLINDPAHRQRVNAMRAALDAHMIRVNDNGFIPEGAPLEGYAQSRVPGAYPLPAVMALAGRAITRNPANLATFVAQLKAANPVLRYWAAAGCLMLANRASSAADALQSRMDTDSWVQVRIVAAEALARAGRPQPAVAFLARTLTSAVGAPIQLQVLDALTHLGTAARAALPAVRKATTDKDTDVRDAALYLRSVLEK